MPNEPLVYPLRTLTTAEREELVAWYDALPELPRNFITSADVAHYLRETLRPAFGLSSEQERGVSRFLMDNVLEPIPMSAAADRLSATAGVDLAMAGQIVKELETNLLVPAGLSLTGIQAPPPEPELVFDEKGVAGMRYTSADDLLADIAPLAPGDRDRFLTDAKRDNRIIVLQILSQLKLGADSGGMPLSFRQLVAAEAADLTAPEWSDLARTDPDALAEPDIARHIASTPLGAMLQGRDPAAAHDVVLQFNALDDDARRIAVGPETATAIQDLVAGGLVPATHTAAIGRIVFFILTGQAAAQDVAGLLQKVGLTAPAADAAAGTVSALIGTPVETRPEIQPSVGEPVAPRTPGLNVPNTAGRTILDLRPPNRQAGKPQI